MGAGRARCVDKADIVIRDNSSICRVCQMYVQTRDVLTSIVIEVAVDEVDLTKYMGKWYQVYGDGFNNIFQGGGHCSTADYSLLEDGRVSVLNKQLDENDKIDGITGFAYYSEGDCCGYLTVELKDLKPAPYWILELGPIVSDNYQYSIVSDNLALSLMLINFINSMIQLY